MTADTALRLTALLTGLASALAAAELLLARRVLADDGVWRHATLAPELGPAAPLLTARGILVVVALQCVLGVALALGIAPWPAPLLLGTALLVQLRFRGPFNGGSDAMQVVLLLGLAVAHLGGTPGATRLGLLYVAVQVTLSYAVAGVVKLVQPAWWRGDALGAALASPVYGAPSWAAALLDSPARRVAASALLIAFECAMPLAWLGPAWAMVLLPLGLAFHLVMAWVLGLNRFLWMWAAAYPALWWAAGGRG